MNKKPRLLTATAILCALSVTLSTLVVFPNMAPFQHAINVIGAVILGPWYNFLCALLTGLIRMGTGRPITSVIGAVVGALLSGLAYKKTASLPATWVGEVFGTGILSAILSYPFMKYLYGLDLGSPFYYIPFFVPSTVVGASIGILALLSLKRAGKLSDLELWKK